MCSANIIPAHLLSKKNISLPFTMTGSNGRIEKARKGDPANYHAVKFKNGSIFIDNIPTSGQIAMKLHSICAGPLGGIILLLRSNVAKQMPMQSLQDW